MEESRERQREGKRMVETMVCSSELTELSMRDHLEFDTANDMTKATDADLKSF